MEKIDLGIALYRGAQQPGGNPRPMTLIAPWWRHLLLKQDDAG